MTSRSIHVVVPPGYKKGDLFQVYDKIGKKTYTVKLSDNFNEVHRTIKVTVNDAAPLLSKVQGLDTSFASEIEDDKAGISLVEDSTSKVFAQYQCKSLSYGSEHPGEIVEPSALAGVRLPEHGKDYPLRDSLPQDIIKNGKLSALQLESVVYACNRHRLRLPTGERAGFFIGDGTGVGKGRQLAGIIFDNLARGRPRHIWFSVSQQLRHDAERDLRDLGMHGVVVINGCQELDKRGKKALGLGQYKNGVLYCTYATLVSKGSSKSSGSRLDAIVKWCTPKTGKAEDFDGVILFDESHKAKNFDPSSGGSGSRVGKCVHALQARLPNARVVYCSATGVSEIGNMAFMTRLGIFGKGTSFPTFDGFKEDLQSRGVGALELLAMDMKSAGMYVARGLGFADCEFRQVDANLTNEQIELYNVCVKLWSDIKIELEKAIEKTGTNTGRIWTQYWGNHQRFFNQLCQALKLRTVIAEASSALAAGMAVVIGLQSTGESGLIYALERQAKAKATIQMSPSETGQNDTLVNTIVASNMIGLVEKLLENHFPTSKECRTLYSEGLQNDPTRQFFSDTSSESEHEDEKMNIKSTVTIDENGDIKEETGASSSVVFRMPHSRHDCPKYVWKEATPSERRLNVCKFCYCYICDVPVSECREWGEDGGRHYNAYKSSLYDAERLSKRKEKEQSLRVSPLKKRKLDKKKGRNKNPRIETIEEPQEIPVRAYTPSEIPCDRKLLVLIPADGIKNGKYLTEKQRTTYVSIPPYAQPGVAFEATAVIRVPVTYRIEEKIILDCLHARDALLHRCRSLNLPSTPLDDLIDELGGPDNVAEMTGRRLRVIDGAVETRYGGAYVPNNGSKRNALRKAFSTSSGGGSAESINLKEQRAFMNDEKRVAIISDAASTGISLHAARDCKNQRRRYHITLELPWSADKAVQQLGRSHRSNSASSPIFSLVVSDLAGEKRFVSTIAKRLAALGAITRGDRRASGLDLSEFNFCDKYGRKALEDFYRALVENGRLCEGVKWNDVHNLLKKSQVQPPVLTSATLALLEKSEERNLNIVGGGGWTVHALIQKVRQFAVLMGLATTTHSSSSMLGGTLSCLQIDKKCLRKVKLFLNRLLGIPARWQSVLFGIFQLKLEDNVRRAKAEGTYNNGVADIHGIAKESTNSNDSVVIFTDRTSNATARVRTFFIDRGVSFSDAVDRMNNAKDTSDIAGFYKSKKKIAGRHLVALAIPSADSVHKVLMVRPNTGPGRTKRSVEMLLSVYQRVTPEEAESNWNEIYNSLQYNCTHGLACPKGGPKGGCTVGSRTLKLLLVTGYITPIFGDLKKAVSSGTLSKSQSALNIVRVTLSKNASNTGEVIVGIKFPEERLDYLKDIVHMRQQVKNSTKDIARVVETRYGAVSLKDIRLEQRGGYLVFKRSVSAYKIPRSSILVSIDEMKSMLMPPTVAFSIMLEKSKRQMSVLLRFIPPIEMQGKKDLRQSNLESVAPVDAKLVSRALRPAQKKMTSFFTREVSLSSSGKSDKSASSSNFSWKNDKKRTKRSRTKTLAGFFNRVSSTTGAANSNLKKSESNINSRKKLKTKVSPSPIDVIEIE
eukprot:g1903.t1